eukprot:6180306-Pleurochrysis_carterae.AAC.2
MHFKAFAFQWPCSPSLSCECKSVQQQQSMPFLEACRRSLQHTRGDNDVVLKTQYSGDTLGKWAGWKVITREVDVMYGKTLVSMEASVVLSIFYGSFFD